MMNVTEVAAALIWENGRFMICRRPAHKARGLLWEFVGGKVEKGETGQQALVRECMEELAVKVTVGDVFTECTSIRISPCTLRFLTPRSPRASRRCLSIATSNG